MNALLLDDEADARIVLREMLRMFCPMVNSIFEADEGSKALSIAQQQRIDLAFVDVELRTESGLELAQFLLPHCGHLIFVTAHDKYAVEAFQTPALHYLVKPVIPKHLKEAVARGKQFTAVESTNHKKLLLPTRTSIIILEQHEIMHIRGDGNYCHFHCTDGKNYYMSRNLSYYEKLVSPQLFYRVHQSHLVNLSFVRSVNSQDGSMVELKNGVEIPLAQNRKANLLSVLKYL